MKILTVTEHFLPELGGAEVLLDRLTREWARAGHDVTLLTFPWRERLPPEASPRGRRVVYLAHRDRRFLGTGWRVASLAGWLRRHAPEFDVVLVSMLKHLAFATLLAAPKGLPVFLRAEGGGAGGDVAWQRSARFGSWITRTCRRANGIIAPSAAIAGEMIAHGYEPDRIDVVPNGVPIPTAAWNAAETSAVRKKLRLPDAPTICYTGRLHEAKGLADLMEAMALLSDRRTRLLLVGEGPEETRLRRQSQDLRLESRVEFVGRVDDVTDYLRASNLFVLPSYHEGLSGSLLEALALGMPAIASDIDGNRELAASLPLPLVATHHPRGLAEAMTVSLAHVDRERLAENRDAVTRAFGIERTAARHVESFIKRRAGERE
ncbi:glycosyltransferase [Kolteria novifilia]|uniref:glycosyltransferase n=1 Tax=Kolteria novifilia TaxID=2527975 RepID=UPI003AF3A576